eukprot:493659_1
MADSSAPPKKKRRLDPYSKRVKELNQQKEKDDQQKLLKQQRIQKRLETIKTLENLGIDQKQAIFCQHLIDVGKPAEDQIIVGSNNCTKISILAFKLKQVLENIERFMKYDPQQVIEYTVYKNKLTPQEQNKSSEFSSFFAVFNSFFGQFNWYFEFSSIKTTPKLLGVPVNECVYIKTFGNPCIQSAQETFSALLNINSSLASSELKKKFSRKRQYANDKKWPKYLFYVQEIIDKQEKKEKKTDSGIDENGYVFRMVQTLIKSELKNKINSTLPISTNNKINRILGQGSQRMTRRLIIMAMHQLPKRQYQRCSDSNSNSDSVNTDDEEH